MNKANKFLKLFCLEKRDNGKICYSYLGDIQTNTPNTTRKYCNHHGILYEFESNGAGDVTRTILDKNYRTETLESIAVVEA